MLGDNRPENSCSKPSLSSLKPYCASGWVTALMPTQPCASQQPQQLTAADPSSQSCSLSGQLLLASPTHTCMVQFQLLNLLIQLRWNVKLGLLILGCVTFELESSLHFLICERGVDVLSHFLLKEYLLCGASQVALVVKNPPANAGGTRDMGLLPESGSSPGGQHGNRLQYSGLENAWTEEPGGLQPMGSQRAGHD